MRVFNPCQPGCVRSSKGPMQGGGESLCTQPSRAGARLRY